MKKQVIAFAGWWTWWHIFPIKSLIEKIDKDKYTILWFGNKNSLEEKIAYQLKEQGFDIIFISVLSWKIRRSLKPKDIYLNIVDFFKNVLGFFQSFYYICKYQPKFVFSKWWFVAFNPSLAWKICFKKIYLHESDTIPGLVNKLVSKFANKVFLWFDYAKKYIKNANTEVVWQIIQDDFYKDYDLEKEDKTNLLIIWWSQWAKIIIESIKTLLDKWKLQEFNIFIVWWLLNKENIFQNYDNVNFYWFLSQKELIKLYKKADISITRGSATSLAEQDQFDIKKIIVPLPYTGWNHQYFNALEYEKKWDIFLSQLDKDFVKKLDNKLEEFKNYKKIKGEYRKDKDSKNIILEKIL